ncbi:aldehyde dehydrogenase [Agrobacterium rhizogenes]|uniref:aldehyde dehydrogenase n=1 Tax=Rhizobium TaxID=379 RepID=UPI00026ED6AA|nr:MULTISPECIES: aldehyde dehydrogenase [Rhizobium]KAA6487622.1 aldehyde dehydrogenase [Agrobacterium sp. ICMP 7243]OCI96306.1 aldehyde dehydrogenase PuuC [Agrobacterium sp. 13-626]EJK81077.1 NAD-dependent aldehyde dehydrogenase [Rhizobium sp. AP16]KEA08066.1 aldehyde dehydrogenase [Rhizobium rhizogenes]MQB31660.1 aldehyde dehydrogenase [Rhizobium rhizogenes]
MTAVSTHATWHQKAEKLKLEGGLFIDGTLLPARSGKLFESINPANGAVIAEVAQGDAADIDRAVASGLKAFKSGIWSRKAPRERMAVMLRFADLIEAHREEFALIDTMDMGKPISEMLNVDIPLALLCFRFTAECIDKVQGSVGATSPDILSYLLRQPLGVIGCIVPWNYPLLMTAWKIAPALSAGNSVVLKPAEQSPLSAILLARLFVEAGGPEGVLNVVNGFGPEAGKALALHHDVEKIAFTGSVEIGKLMMVYSGQSNLKKVSTECGGKSPHVIMADATDLEAAASWAAMGIFGNQGEVCCAGSRILVERKILKDFTDIFREKAETGYRPGDPLDPSTSMGPLVDFGQQKRVLNYIGIGKQAGAECVLGGGIPAGLEKGAFVSPTIFTGVNNQMTIAREEIFGPVASIIAFDGFEEAVSIANDTSFGLAAGIWTSDLGKAHRFARDVEAGMVYINSYMTGDMQLPFGGWKESGNGRDKCMDALTSYTQTKGVWATIG